MGNIISTCPACKKNFEVDASLQGHLIDCPVCNTAIEVPDRRLRPVIPAGNVVGKPAAGGGSVIVVDVQIPFNSVLTITWKVVMSLFLIGLLVGIAYGICRWILIMVAG